MKRAGNPRAELHGPRLLSLGMKEGVSATQSLACSLTLAHCKVSSVLQILSSTIEETTSPKVQLTHQKPPSVGIGQVTIRTQIFLDSEPLFFQTGFHLAEAEVVFKQQASCQCMGWTTCYHPSCPLELGRQPCFPQSLGLHILDVR